MYFNYCSFFNFTVSYVLWRSQPVNNQTRYEVCLGSVCCEDQHFGICVMFMKTHNTISPYTTGIKRLLGIV